MEWKEKQENGCLSPLRSKLHYGRINCIHVFFFFLKRIWQVNLSFLKAKVFSFLKSWHSAFWSCESAQQTSNLYSQTQLPFVLRAQGERGGEKIVRNLDKVSHEGSYLDFRLYCNQNDHRLLCDGGTCVFVICACVYLWYAKLSETGGE